MLPIQQHTPLCQCLFIQKYYCSLRSLQHASRYTKFILYLFKTPIHHCLSSVPQWPFQGGYRSSPHPPHGVASGISRCACRYQYVFPVVDLCKACKTQTRLAGISCLAAQDLAAGNGRVRKIFEHGTVICDPAGMDIRHSCRMPRTLNDLSERIVPKRIPEQHRNISHCTVMIRIMKPCRITEMCTIHSNPLCLLIHQLHKSIPGTAYGIRQCDTTLRTGWQHGTIKKIDGPHGLTG